MRTLNLTECTTISGALSQPQICLIGAAAITGGLITGIVSLPIALSPVGPVIGATAGAIALGGFCAQFSPIVGTLGCSLAGGAIGYSQGPIILAAATMYLGGAAAAFYVFYKIKN